MDDRLTDTAQRVIVCAGPPFCSLVGDAAVKAARSGCPWCTRIRVDEYGRELSREGPTCA